MVGADIAVQIVICAADGSRNCKSACCVDCMFLRETVAILISGFVVIEADRVLVRQIRAEIGATGYGKIICRVRVGARSRIVDEFTCYTVMAYETK